MAVQTLEKNQNICLLLLSKPVCDVDILCVPHLGGALWYPFSWRKSRPDWMMGASVMHRNPSFLLPPCHLSVHLPLSSHSCRRCARLHLCPLPTSTRTNATLPGSSPSTNLCFVKYTDSINVGLIYVTSSPPLFFFFFKFPWYKLGQFSTPAKTRFPQIWNCLWIYIYIHIT